MKQLLSVIFFIISLITVQAQDMIYTTAGNKFSAKVVEINANEVKYKDFANMEGPTYVITRQDVVLITYQNGGSEIITPNPPNYSPNKTPIEYATKKPGHANNPNELYYVGKNFVSLNALALMNGDFTLLYDRDLLDNKLGITVMGGYNFNDRINKVLNLYIDNLYPNAKKVFDAGLGLNYFPSSKGRGQYFVGVMAKYMGFNYDKETTYEEVIGGFTYLKKKVERGMGSQTMFGVTNGILVRVAPSFNFKIFATVGLAAHNPASTTTTSVNNPGTYPKFYLGYCLGYRF